MREVGALLQPTVGSAAFAPVNLCLGPINLLPRPCLHARLYATCQKNPSYAGSLTNNLLAALQYASLDCQLVSVL